MCEFKEIKNLACASKEEQRIFFGSFDSILSDIDGVIWFAYNPLPGASECITNLKKLGKSISFVTNNATMSTENILKLLKKYNFPVNADDVVSPVTGYISLLNKLHFDKTIFVLGFEELKGELRKAGFKVAPNPPHSIEEVVPEIVKHLADDEEIGAVIVDYDINLSLLKLQKVLTYLKRSDCLFIIGAGDKSLPFPHVGPLMGNHYFFESLKELSGRKPQQMAKPSPDFCKFIKQKCSITNPKRVLFIGDSINEDMKFATHSEYQKLLVLTGVTKKEDLDNWKHDEKYKPDYFVESLGALNLILGMLQIQRS